MTYPVHLRIQNVLPDVKAYEGANNNTGQVHFAQDGSGWLIKTPETAKFREAGPSITLAMGMTEECVQNGRGKVVFFSTMSNAATPFILKYFSEEYAKLPQLLYLDYFWSDQERAEWFNTPHWQRLDLLNARAGAIHPNVPVTPITLFFEVENYDNIRMPEGIEGAVAMYYNKSGIFYVGAINDISQHMSWHHVPPALAVGDGRNNPRRPFWVAPVANITAFRRQSALEAIRYLQRQHSNRPREVLWRYSGIRSLVIQAHDQLAAAGGYDIANNSALGPDIAHDVEQARVRRGNMDGQGTRLEQIQAITASWGPFAQLALRRYQQATRQGIFVVSRYMIENDEWLQLSKDDKLLAIELCELQSQLDVIDPVRPLAGHDAGGDQDEDDDEEGDGRGDGLARPAAPGRGFDGGNDEDDDEDGDGADGRRPPGGGFDGGDDERIDAPIEDDGALARDTPTSKEDGRGSNIIGRAGDETVHSEPTEVSSADVAGPSRIPGSLRGLDPASATLSRRQRRLVRRARERGELADLFDH